MTSAPYRARVLALLAVSLLASVSVTACSGDSDNAATKLPVTTQTATATATSPPSLGPEAAVEAAVRHYFAVANEAVKTGGTVQLEALSLSGCPCRALVEDINSVYANGRAETSGFDVSSVLVTEVQGSTAAAEVRYIVPPYKVLDQQGRTIQEVSLYDGNEYISLVRVGSSWLLGNTFNLNGESNQ